MKKFRLFLVKVWQPTVGYSVALFLLAGLLFFQLGTMVPGFSQPELEARATTRTARAIVNDPLNLPHKILQYGLQRFGNNGTFALRTASAISGFVFVILFYRLLRRWQTVRIAILGTVLFATSSWFLHISRLATAEILLMSLVALVLSAQYFRHSRQTALGFMALVSVSAGLLYVPAGVWFLLLGLWWQRRNLRRELSQLPVMVLLMSLLWVTLLLTPLITALTKQPELLKPFLGAPQEFPNFATMVRNVAEVPFNLFWQGPDDPVRWLGQAPILDLFTIGMLILGIYANAAKGSTEMLQAMLGVFTLSLIFIGLNGPVTVTILLPWVYFLAASGIAWFLQQWLTVFPRNPFAKSVGVGLVAAAVLVSCTYHLVHYFVGWPAAPETKRVFNLRS